MKEACDDTAHDWRPHGTYRRATGEKIQRLRCKVCGRTQVAHAEEPTYQLKPRTETYSPVDAWQRFMNRLGEDFLRVGFARALENATRESGITQRTARKWAAEARPREIPLNPRLSALQFSFFLQGLSNYQAASFTYLREAELPQGLELEVEHVFRMIARARMMLSLVRAPLAGSGPPQMPWWILSDPFRALDADPLLPPERWKPSQPRIWGAAKFIRSSTPAGWWEQHGSREWLRLTLQEQIGEEMIKWANNMKPSSASELLQRIGNRPAPPEQISLEQIAERASHYFSRASEILGDRNRRVEERFTYLLCWTRDLIGVQIRRGKSPLVQYFEGSTEFYTKAGAIEIRPESATIGHHPYIADIVDESEIPSLEDNAVLQMHVVTAEGVKRLTGCREEIVQIVG